MSESESLLTVGEIARRLGKPVHRIEYLLRSRKVQPLAWAGNARIYSQADLDYLASELRRLAADRGEV